jgi:hypothetical protein
MQENLERKKTNKSQVINTRDTGDLYYRGSVLENLIPVEESTEDGSFSTLSLSLPITKTGELFESRLEGGVNRANLKFNNLSTTTSRVSVRNINESERGRKNKSQANKECGTRICFTEVRFSQTYSPLRWSQRPGLFQPFPSLKRSLGPSELLFSIKREQTSPQGPPHNWCLLPWLQLS